MNLIFIIIISTITLSSTFFSFADLIINVALTFLIIFQVKSLLYSIQSNKNDCALKLLFTQTNHITLFSLILVYCTDTFCNKRYIL